MHLVYKLIPRLLSYYLVSCISSEAEMENSGVKPNVVLHPPPHPTPPLGRKSPPPPSSSTQIFSIVKCQCFPNQTHILF